MTTAAHEISTRPSPRPPNAHHLTHVCTYTSMYSTVIPHTCLFVTCRTTRYAVEQEAKAAGAQQQQQR